MSKTWSFSEMIDKTIDVHLSLGRRHADTDPIEFLRALKDTEAPSIPNTSADKIYRLLNLFLDASGIISATEGSFDSFSIGDTSFIGSRKDIEGYLSGNEENYRDWMCSVLFRGWAKGQKHSFNISEDLRHSAPKGTEACDFKVTGEFISPTLMECKRIHPGDEYSLSNVYQKINKKINKAKSQLVSTEEFLKEGDHYKLVLIDISPYGYKTVREHGTMKIVGFQSDTDITQIVQYLLQEQPKGIDKIIICWSNLYYFQNYPRAFVYYTQPIHLSKKPDSNVNYLGWTVGWYPNVKQGTNFRELHISSIARPKAWVKASWYSSTDNMNTFRSIEHRKSSSEFNH